RIAPRSHLAWSDTNGNCAFGETVNVVAPAGSCLIFEGRTAHGTDVNRRHESRYAVATFYCEAQFKPLVDFTHVTRPEIVTALPPELLQRLGFAIESRPDRCQSVPRMGINRSGSGQLPVHDELR